jgi:hypothetical protein
VEGEVLEVLFILVVVGVIVAGIALAALYDYRARRRGWSVSASTEEAFHNRLDVKSLSRSGPMLHGGKQGWMTYRRRDRNS